MSLSVHYLLHSIFTYLNRSVIELAEKGGSPADPMSRWLVNLLGDWEFHGDNVVSGGTSGGEDTLTQTSLVHGARVFVRVGHVVLRGLKVDQWHLVIEFILKV